MTTYTDARGILVTTTENYRGVTGLTLLVEAYRQPHGKPDPRVASGRLWGNSAAIYLDLVCRPAPATGAVQPAPGPPERA
ncbi:MAG: hypothetical protein U0531_10190 [Dehalococcoidia bacterium]